MSVTHFYDGVEMFDDSGCANMWKYFVHWEKHTQSPVFISQQSTIARHEQLHVNAISVVIPCSMAQHHIMIQNDPFKMSVCKNVQCL